MALPQFAYRAAALTDAVSVPKTDYADTTVIVPTLNEASNIGTLLQMLLELYPRISVIVADDGSTDRTCDIVRSFGATRPTVTLLDRKAAATHGLTISVVDAALATKTPFFIVIDGDMQHPPERIRDLHDRLLDGASVVVGTRNKVLVPWPWHRRLMSRTAVMLGRLRLFISGASTRDTMSGFFAARTEIFKQYAAPNRSKFEARGYKVLFDFLKLLPRSTRVDEVPYDFGLRAGGGSKLNSRHLLLYARSLFRR